jgi:two-component system cell cycle sensor histidine kinase/response regulator CckA
MQSQPQSRDPARTRPENVVRSAALLTVAIGIVALVGWTFDLAPLKSLLPGLASMKPNSALGFILCGTALALLASATVSTKTRWLARIAAAVAVAIGVLTLGEQLSHANLHIDTWQFAGEALAEGGASPGRMSPGNALCLIFSGAALLSLRRRRAEWLAAGIGALSIVVLAGYAYSFEAERHLVSYTSFSVPSAIAFIVLSTGILFAGPGHGLVSTLYSNGTSGTMLRRLIPAAVIIPISLAWATQEGERLGGLSDPIPLGVMAAATIMAFGAVIWVTANAIAATEAKRAAAAVALGKSEESYRDLFGSAPVGLSHSALNGAILQANDACVRLFGYSDADALKRVKAEDFYANPDDRTRLQRLREDPAAGTSSVEADLKRADGTIVTVQLYSRLVGDGGPGSHFLNAIIDITQRKKLEQQFVQAQKMEAVGRLAGGVAHDFNNLLTVIRSYCDLVLLEMPAGAPMRDDLREISSAADRAASLARQLLSFSRKQVLLPQVLNPNTVVQEVHSMLRRVLPSSVSCDMKIADDLGAIRADPGQVDQVLMNLAINASDAMPGGGRLCIETSNATIDAAYARSHSNVDPGEYVCIAVSDTGTGMDRETMSHVFEPFFTTKPVGKGTGLGLATVYGIVEQNHGHVWVYSEPGEGTTFKIYFPRVADAPDELPRRSVAINERPTGPTPVVLVVEDDESVRATISKVLGRQGYTVLTAGHGGEGVRVGTEHTGAINLVISDVMMPEMGGREFVERLAKLHPESRVLLISGYTDDDVLRRGLIDPSFAFLEKPFTVDQLVRKVQGVLS